MWGSWDTEQNKAQVCNAHDYQDTEALLAELLFTMLPAFLHLPSSNYSSSLHPELSFTEGNL